MLALLEDAICNYDVRTSLLLVKGFDRYLCRFNQSIYRTTKLSLSFMITKQLINNPSRLSEDSLDDKKVVCKGLDHLLIHVDLHRIRQVFYRS